MTEFNKLPPYIYVVQHTKTKHLQAFVDEVAAKRIAEGTQSSWHCCVLVGEVEEGLTIQDLVNKKDQLEKKLATLRAGLEKLIGPAKQMYQTLHNMSAKPDLLRKAAQLYETLISLVD